MISDMKGRRGEDGGRGEEAEGTKEGKCVRSRQRWWWEGGRGREEGRHIAGEGGLLSRGNFEGGF